MRILFGTLAMALVWAGPAAADRAAADRCAARLPKEARAIYSASVPRLGPGADGRAIVTEQTRALVMSGSVDHLTANQSAEAAAQCLMLLR